MAFTVPQTSYVMDPPAALAGMSSDISPKTTFSRLLETAAGANAGLFVVDGTTPSAQCKLPTAAGDVTNKLMGVIRLQSMKAPASPNFAQKDAVSVQRRGPVWVTIGPDGLTEGDETLFVVHSGAHAGKVQGVAGAGPDATAIPNGAAKCIKVDAALGLAEIDLNLP